MGGNVSANILKNVKKKLTEGKIIDDYGVRDFVDEEYPADWSQEMFPINLVAGLVAERLGDEEKLDADILRSVIEDVYEFAGGKEEEIDNYITKKLKEVNNCRPGSKSADKPKKSKKAIKEGAGLDVVFTVCYNGLSVWKSRKEAIRFYKDCASFSEGAEKERYTIILLDLMDGADFTIDNYDEDDSVREIDWMGETPKSGQCSLAKEELGGFKSAKDVVGQIKSGKILPPKEFLSYLEESKKLNESEDVRPLTKEEMGKLKKLGRNDLEIMVGPNTKDYYIYSNSIDAYYPVGPESKYSEEDIEKMIADNPEFFKGDWMFGDYDL